MHLFSYAESHDDMTATLRQFVKDKKFELRDFSKYGLENVLVVPRNKVNQVQSSLYPAIAIYSDMGQALNHLCIAIAIYS